MCTLKSNFETFLSSVSPCKYPYKSYVGTVYVGLNTYIYVKTGSCIVFQ